MEKEIIETYHFNPSDFNYDGRRLSDGKSFRDVIKDFECIYSRQKFHPHVFKDNADLGSDTINTIH